MSAAATATSPWRTFPLLSRPSSEPSGEIQIIAYNVTEFGCFYFCLVLIIVACLLSVFLVKVFLVKGFFFIYFSFYGSLYSSIFIQSARLAKPSFLKKNKELQFYSIILFYLYNRLLCLMFFSLCGFNSPAPCLSLCVRMCGCACVW